MAITPCRQFDSRSVSPLLDNTPRAVTLTGVPCNIPAIAQAAAVNITVFNITGSGSNGVLKVGVASPPTTAWINYPPTETQRANAGVVALTASGEIVLQINQGAGSVDFTVDVSGYYAPQGIVNSLNALSGDVTLSPGSNVTITPSGQALTIASSAPQGPTGPAGPTGPSGPTGPAGPGSGTFYKSISAIACTAQGTAISGDSTPCTGGGMLRTAGDTEFPCGVRARESRDTYVCDLDLPDGAILEEIISYGTDLSTTGYFEAAVWRSSGSSVSPTFPSSGFGGTWQSTGVSFAGGSTSFPIFQTSDTPHTIDGDYRYTIGFGLVAPSGGVAARGFRVRYTIP